MTQDTRVCRFCLESKETKRNVLLDPCECRGSIQFVHERCLTRWRRIDPARNAEICLLCMTPYKHEFPIDSEMIPTVHTIPLMFLRFPILLCFTVNYIFLLQISIQGKTDFNSLFESYQYVFQLLYALFFIRHWRVRNRELYWREWAHISTTFLFLFHILCNGFLHLHHHVAIIPLNAILGFYWYRHRNILVEINMQE